MDVSGPNNSVIQRRWFSLHYLSGERKNLGIDPPSFTHVYMSSFQRIGEG